MGEEEVEQEEDLQDGQRECIRRNMEEDRGKIKLVQEIKEEEDRRDFFFIFIYIFHFPYPSPENGGIPVPRDTYKSNKFIHYIIQGNGGIPIT